MGQYYHVILDKNGNREYYDMQSRKYWDSRKAGTPDYEEYNGLKLMEHSYCENPLCEAIALRLVDNPMRVCWVGDYAEPEECESLGFTYDEVWNCPDGKYQHYEETKFKMDSVKYLVNNNKKIYLDLQKYKKNCDRDGWCIFPISLLTALGNDRGGGDFHEGNVGYSDVGTWVFDEIYLTNTLPDGYAEEEYCFVEE